MVKNLLVRLNEKELKIIILGITDMIAEIDYNFKKKEIDIKEVSLLDDLKKDYNKLLDKISEIVYYPKNIEKVNKKSELIDSLTNNE